ncbi:Golgi-associated RAB2 interactor protein 5A-like [Cuculus canorus]|uniref:Golgi-associated RAB2 interactor protein 5A-like n=1 Tax=Cuculus canorus TaxID=55661 RepID=UPI0023AB0150|nr:Golgi-associated RAB2 interactor protein 5A-like [Cuculus canorus]
MGRLSRCLELGHLRHCPLFESDFEQVTWSGEPAGRVTVGVVASSPLLPLPDVLVLALPLAPPEPEELRLLALLPLSCVRLSVRRHHRHQLRARLPTGRTFYLRLLAPRGHRHRLFGSWVRLLGLLGAQ